MKIVIIGSGLITWITMHEIPSKDIVIVEARKRIGGRIQTKMSIRTISI